VLPGEAHGGSRDWGGVVARSATEAATFGGPGRHRGAAAATGGRGGSEIPRIRGSGEIEGRREQVDAVEAKFRASVEAEKSKEDVLARKFAEGLKKAKDGPIEKPLRDFDLD